MSGSATYVAGAIAGLLALAPASAQTSDEFYKGKTLTLAIGSGVGGGMDANARSLGRALARHLPGQPNFIIQNMPGAGGVRVLNYLYSQAPRDGTVVGGVQAGALLDPLIGAHPTNYAISDFGAVGALESDISACMTWSASRVKTLDDARKYEATMAGIGAGASTDTEPILLNATLGTKFKLVTGYAGAPETAMAIERGEVDGRCGFSFGMVRMTSPEWLAKARVNVIVQVGFEKSPFAPDAPLALDLVKTPEQRQMLGLIAATRKLAGPYLAPPGAPPERLADLRRAFSATLADPEFLAEYSSAHDGDPPHPTGGAEMAAIIASLEATPATTIARVKALLGR